MIQTIKHTGPIKASHLQSTAPFDSNPSSTFTLVAPKSIPAKFSASFRSVHLVLFPHTKWLAFFHLLILAVAGFIARSSVLADKDVIALSAKVGILPNDLAV